MCDAACHSYMIGRCRSPRGVLKTKYYIWNRIELMNIFLFIISLISYPAKYTFLVIKTQFCDQLYISKYNQHHICLIRIQNNNNTNRRFTPRITLSIELGFPILYSFHSELLPLECVLSINVVKLCSDSIVFMKDIFEMRNWNTNHDIIECFLFFGATYLGRVESNQCHGTQFVYALDMKCISVQWHSIPLDRESIVGRKLRLFCCFFLDFERSMHLKDGWG